MIINDDLRLDPYDGFRAKTIELHGQHRIDVYITCVSRNIVAVLWSCQFDETASGLAVARGKASRVMLVATAAAQFLNSGGSLAVLRSLLGAIGEGIEMGTPYGWPLLAVTVDEDQTSYVFSDPDSDKCLVWVEDQYAEETTLGALSYADRSKSDD